MAEQVLTKQFEDFANRLADEAERETIKRFRCGTQVFNKAGIWFDPVTEADREAERAQRRIINAVHPDHGIIGEEFGIERADAQWRWVLDPVDGTRAFVCGTCTWTTLIGLEFEKVPVLGIIDQPFVQERWIGSGTETRYSLRGADRTVKASSIKDLSKARLSTTDPRRNAYFSKIEEAGFARVAEKVRLTRFSMDAYAYGLLALGELDLVIESGLQHHDYAALVPIVHGAGGVITNWSGGDLGSDDRCTVIAAATRELHEAAMALLVASD